MCLERAGTGMDVLGEGGKISDSMDATEGSEEEAGVSEEPDQVSEKLM